jgi:hypothetical protein
MSDVALFAVGSVVFVVTAWASIAYGLAYVHQLRMQDLEDSSDVTEIRAESQYTDIYVRNPDGAEQAPSDQGQAASAPRRG